MPTLNYSGEQTTDVQGVQTLVSQLVNTNQQDNDIIVRSTSLRFQDDGSLRVMVSMESDGGFAEVESLKDSLQQEAADLGFESTDGVVLL